MPRTDISGNANPKIPSNLAAKNETPDNEVASPKSTSLTSTPATLTKSFETNAFTPPLPYFISKLVPFYLYVVEDLLS